MLEYVCKVYINDIKVKFTPHHQTQSFVGFKDACFVLMFI